MIERLLNALGPNGDFIIAAYAFTGAALLALLIWIMADKRQQEKRVAALEAARHDHDASTGHTP